MQCLRGTPQKISSLFLGKEKQYRVNNRDKILEQKKQKMTCECGCSLNRDNIKRHKRAKKHLELLKQSQ